VTTARLIASAPLRLRALPWLLLVYAAGSLWHFGHNGAFLHHYPNLPLSWSPQQVYAAGAGLALLGLCGYLMYRRGLTLPGLSLLTLVCRGWLRRAAALHARPVRAPHRGHESHHLY